ncbi:MAG: tetrapyrrole methylase family protein / MazG family protein [Candidatus Saganbacteria bacterium]|uniref:Tetrapyrrole methylase family protein / MazG family protein n=1 Tax=Candidatus Saganbacteria bacterium TaxID=2575572 RepID=A0A833L255_UNCSA|nr:MAG: tetrapyrrole methylase family protein / MazG family protein [Candidatus Saganbacteria bacterium]
MVKLNKMKEFDRLVEVVAVLRKKCPWDKNQTHKSLKPYMIEEVNEAIEAIDLGNHKHLAEEIGDMLLHIIMHAEIAKEKNKFDIKDVLENITEKMIRRHPHVFGKGKARTIKGVLKKWKQIKKEEKKREH